MTSLAGFLPVGAVALMKQNYLMCIGLFVQASCALAQLEPPRLIVQLVVDQLRGDLLQQYQHDFSSNGFNYLLKHAINYQNAHHPHALTVTCVGHATIATGSSPSLHGIIANEWYDRHNKKTIYCTEDKQSPTLPTNRSKENGPGQSPRNLTASTFSDELVLAQKGRSFAVSLKDRSAITLAGHAGKAFWFDKTHGGFVTSRYYYTQYPLWVVDWNQHYQPQKLTWSLLHPLKTYHYGQVPSPNRPFPGYGSQFPHQIGEASSENYFKYLAMSPYADQLTGQFAEQLLTKEHLGTDPQKTDYLAISFSAVDIIGHQFGPNSLESEDTIKQLDNTIASLLKALDTQVGLNHVLIVLTADHGVTDSPIWLKSNHMQPLPALNTEKLKQTLITALKTRFNLPPETIEIIKLPYVYFNHPLLLSHQLSRHEVAVYLTEILQQQPGIFNAYPLPLTTHEQDWLSIKVAKMNYPKRSGDLFLVPLPYQDLTDSRELLLTHGSPWNYDSYVPLLFVHNTFKPSIVARKVHTTDIAPTLAALMSIKPPSSSIGQPLQELLYAQPLEN